MEHAPQEHIIRSILLQCIGGDISMETAVSMLKDVCARDEDANRTKIWGSLRDHQGKPVCELRKNI
jgi:hypothetical protein